MTQEKKNDGRDGKSLPTSFITGAIALAFLVIGYQTALFIHKAAIAKIISNKDNPDTVFVYGQLPADMAGISSGQDPASWEGKGYRTYRKNSAHSRQASSVRMNHTPRTYESFPFDPNTVTTEDLVRLGFSPAQARSIDNYRKAGGRFRRKEDFEKSYVVADSVYKRLEPYIEIPKTDLNKADSAAFDALPGIGGWYASKMLEFRDLLGGYSYPEQLLDIRNFTRERYDALKDLITISRPAPYKIWSLPEDSLARHPYIGRHSAHSIVLYRENNPPSLWTVEGLAKAGALDAGNAEKLSGCILEKPRDVH